MNRHNSGNLMWGILLIISGVILLLNSTGYLPWNVWQYFWQFWPILLIFGGMHIILGNSPISNAVIAIVSLVAFVFIALYGAVQVKPEIRKQLPMEIQVTIKEMEVWKKPWLVD